jgi:hypothetical protein
MFWKLFAIGFIADTRTIRYMKTLKLATMFAEPVPSEDSRNFLNNIAKKEGLSSLKDILEKKENDRSRSSLKSGCDERYSILYNETDRNEFIFNITQFVFQMNLLRKLESDSVSTVEKIAAIEQYEKDTSDSGYVMQLKSGGLWKDWDM